MNEFNLDSGVLDSLSQILHRNAINNNTLDSLSGKNLVSEVKLNPSELYALYSNNIISRIVDIYPESAFDNGYQVLSSNGDIIDSNNMLILTAFKEASIKARMLGKSFLVFNPDDNSPLNSNLSTNKYKIYENLYDIGGDSWLNKKHLILEYSGDMNQYRRKGYINKIYPKSNVFCFFGKRTYKENVLPDEDDYSSSIIEGFYTQFNNYLSASFYGRKILQNLSNLSLGISQLSIQLRDKSSANKVYERAALLDENRNLNSVILHDKDSENISYISQHLDNVTQFIGHLENLVAASTDGIPKERIFNYDEGSGYYTHLIVRQMWSESVSKWSRVNWLSHLLNIYSQINVNFDKIIIPLPIVLTQLEQSELELNGANRVEKLMRNGVITANEARTGYRNELYTLNIDIDNSKIPTNELSSNHSNQISLDSINKQTLKSLSNVNLPDYWNMGDELADFINKSFR